MAESQGQSSRSLGPTEASFVDLMKRLADSVPGVSAVVVSDRQGLPVASVQKDRTGASVLAVCAMAAMAVQSGEAIAGNLHLEAMSVMIMECGTRKVLVAPVPSRIGIVLVLTEGDSNLGLLRIVMPQFLGRIDDLLRRL